MYNCTLAHVVIDELCIFTYLVNWLLAICSIDAISFDFYGEDFNFKPQTFLL